MKHNLSSRQSAKLGIPAFAAANRVDIDHLLLLQAATMSGIVGVDPNLTDVAPCPVILPASLVAIRRVLEEFSGFVRHLHQSRVNKRRYLRVTDVAKVIGADDWKPFSSYLQTAAQAPAQDRTYRELEGLLDDGSIDPLPPESEIALEAVLRPGFVVESLVSSILEDALRHCHQCTGFFPCPSPTSLPTGKKQREKWLQQLCSFLDGTTIQGKQGLDPGGRSERLSARLQMIMMLAQEDLGALHCSSSNLLSRCVLLTKTVLPEIASLSEELEAHEDQYRDRFVKACRLLHAGRYSARSVFPMDFHTTGAAREFRTQSLAYLSFVENDPVLAECQPILRLPDFLAFGMRALANREDFDVYIIETVFPAARRLAEAHSLEIAAYRYSETVTELHDLAKKLLRMVQRKQPVTQRDLIRSFDQQKLSSYQPVICFLLAEHVLVGEPRSGFRLGPRALSDIDLKKLAVPLPKSLR